MTAKEVERIYAALQHFVEHSSALQSGESIGLDGVVRSGVIVDEWAYIRIARIFWMFVKTEYDLGEGLKVIVSGCGFTGGVVSYCIDNHEKVFMCFDDKDSVNLFICKAKLILDSLFSYNRYKRIKFNHWIAGYDKDRLASGHEHMEVRL